MIRTTSAPRYAASIFNEIENYGYASFRRIYGNWSGKSNGWKEQVLLENSITPVQQFAYTTGKNSTDMAMVIDAMDILYSGKVDGFCLVTSDSDFTRSGHAASGGEYVRHRHGRVQDTYGPDQGLQ